MTVQEWANIQEGLYIVLGPVFVSAIPLVITASVLASLIGGLMTVYTRIRRG